MIVGGVDFSRWKCPNCLKQGNVQGIYNDLGGRQSVQCGCGFAAKFAECQIQPEKPIEHTLMAAPITAWRGWSVRRPETLLITPETYEAQRERILGGENVFAARLFAIAAETPGWEKTAHATCLQAQFTNSIHHELLTEHEAPARSCGCGIWALKSEEAAIKAIRGLYGKTTEKPWAYGKVLMWGRFYEHKLGWRAEYAKPVEIHLSVRDEEIAEELSSFYGCPVEFMDEEIAKPTPTTFNAGGMMIMSPSQTWTTAGNYFYGGGSGGSTALMPLSSSSGYARVSKSGTPSTFLTCSQRWSRYKETGDYSGMAWNQARSQAQAMLQYYTLSSGLSSNFVLPGMRDLTQQVPKKKHGLGNPAIGMTLFAAAVISSLLGLIGGSDGLVLLSWAFIFAGIGNYVSGLWKRKRA